MNKISMLVCAISAATLLASPTENARGGSQMKNNILIAFQSISDRIDTLKWDSFSIDVSNYFAFISNDYTFSDILYEFSDLNGRPPARFVEDHFEVGKIYFLGLDPPLLSKIQLNNNKFRNNYDFTISVKYIGDNQFYLISAKIVNKKTWP